MDKGTSPNYEDPLKWNVGPITMSKSKMFKEALLDLIKDCWIKARSRTSVGPSLYVNMIQVEDQD